MVLLAHYMVSAVNSFTLIAIPSFLLLGSLMSKSGITERLVDFCVALVGWLRGGLSIVTIFACMLFAGMSGSASADSAAVGSATIPALLRQKYERSFAAAIVASGGRSEEQTSELQSLM